MFLVDWDMLRLIGGLNNWFPWNWSILRQMGISAVIVTVVEFVSGTAEPGPEMGCLEFTAICLLIFTVRYTCRLR